MATNIIYFTVLSITIFSVLNFVWMAAGPGPKYNAFRILQTCFHLKKETMNKVYIFVALCAIITGVMSISYVSKANYCSKEI